MTTDQVTKLNLSDGDILIFKGIQPPNELVTAIIKKAQQQGVENILYVFLGHNQTLEQLPEADMLKHGWVKADSREVH